GFGHLQLAAATSATFTLNFTTGSAALGAVKVLTQGAQSLDYTSTSNTTCTGSTPASTACSVEGKFLPTAPGPRTGAVVLFDTSQHPLLTLPLYGWADAPIASLSPNVGSLISTGSVTTTNPFQLALDGAGNTFISNYTGMSVVKIPAGGGSTAAVA